MIKPIKVGRAASPPRGFDPGPYQSRIDAAIGTIRGHSLMKLAWAPSELRWCPHRMEDDPPGYIFPIFCNGSNENGELVAPDRWVLLERVEPEQFAPTWELGRYSKFDGSWWDWKGPVPAEKYIELRAHCIHDGECCPCLGDECKCGSRYAHCWGKYAEPNEHLMDWIRKTAWEAAHDPDVNPTQDIRDFASRHAQTELRSNMLSAQEREKIDFEEFNRHFVDHWEKQPHSVNLSSTLDGAYERAKSLGYGLVVPSLRGLTLPDLDNKEI